MKMLLSIAVAAVLLVGGNACAQVSEGKRTIPATLVWAGYVKWHSAIALGPKDTNQAWAVWTYRDCRKTPHRRIYVKRQLVDSVVFPRPGGLYLLTVAGNGEIEKVVKLPGDRGLKCEGSEQP